MHQSRRCTQCRLHVTSSITSLKWVMLNSVCMGLQHKLSPREAVRLLHSISRNLQKHQIPAYDGLSPFDRVVACARVPLIHFIDRQTNIDCDVCLCNHAGVFKSRFTALLAGVDDRLGALYRVVKLWTCQHGLNDPKAGTLNSWSIMQLVSHGQVVDVVGGHKLKQAHCGGDSAATKCDQMSCLFLMVS